MEVFCSHMVAEMLHWLEALVTEIYLVGLTEEIFVFKSVAAPSESRLMVLRVIESLGLVTYPIATEESP